MSYLGNPAIDLGKLVLADYRRTFVPLVAQAYAARPLYQPDVVYSWQALITHIDKMYRQLLSQVTVIPTADDPYPGYEEMMTDIRQHGRMKVYTGASEHPVWTPEENVRFRAVHDYIVHRAGEHNFTLRGELGAYNRHVKIAPPEARIALFTEIVGQTCSYWHNNEQFGEQKVAKLYGFDYVRVGDVDMVEYQKNFNR